MAAELCLPYYHQLVGLCISWIISIDHCIGNDQFSIDTGSHFEPCEISTNGVIGKSLIGNFGIAISQSPNSKI